LLGGPFLVARLAAGRWPVTGARRRAILVAMETILTLGLTGYVIVGVILGLAAIIAMIKAPYRK
jgi:hypothetical protein